MLEAESAFRRGEQLLAAGEVPAAHAAFEEAVQLQPDEGEFLAHAGVDGLPPAPADSEAGPTRLAMLAQAVEKSPALDRAHLYKGHVHKALGQAARPRPSTRRRWNATQDAPRRSGS